MTDDKPTPIELYEREVERRERERERKLSEIRERVETLLRERMSQAMDSAIHLTPAGDIHPDEARAIVQRLREHAASAGLRLRDGWRLVAELVPNWVLVVTARRKDPDGAWHIVDASDPEAWTAVNEPSNPFAL
jgi:hypothetical protein